MIMMLEQRNVSIVFPAQDNVVHMNEYIGIWKSFECTHSGSFRSAFTLFCSDFTYFACSSLRPTLFHLWSPCLPTFPFSFEYEPYHRTSAAFKQGKTLKCKHLTFSYAINRFTTICDPMRACGNYIPQLPISSSLRKTFATYWKYLPMLSCGMIIACKLLVDTKLFFFRCCFAERVSNENEPGQMNIAAPPLLDIDAYSPRLLAEEPLRHMTPNIILCLRIHQPADCRPRYFHHVLNVLNKCVSNKDIKCYIDRTRMGAETFKHENANCYFVQKNTVKHSANEGSCLPHQNTLNTHFEWQKEPLIYMKIIVFLATNTRIVPWRAGNFGICKAAAQKYFTP